MYTVIIWCYILSFTLYQNLLAVLLCNGLYSAVTSLEFVFAFVDVHITVALPRGWSKAMTPTGSPYYIK